MGTVVNQALHGGSLKATLTVPLSKIKRKIFNPHISGPHALYLYTEN